MRAQFPMILVMASLAVGCVPKTEIPLEEIPKVESFTRLMRFQATIADPQMKKADRAVFTEEDWTAFSDVAVRIGAASLKSKDFSRGGDWNQYCMDLNMRAQELGVATNTKDVQGAKNALAGMKQACRACHKKFR